MRQLVLYRTWRYWYYGEIWSQRGNTALHQMTIYQLHSCTSLLFRDKMPAEWQHKGHDCDCVCSELQQRGTLACVSLKKFMDMLMAKSICWNKPQRYVQLTWCRLTPSMFCLQHLTVHEDSLLFCFLHIPCTQCTKWTRNEEVVSVNPRTSSRSLTPAVNY
jgi:hypothetical protein